MKYYVDVFDRGMYQIWEKPAILKCYVISRQVLSSSLIKKLFFDEKKNDYLYKNFVYCLFDDREAKNSKRKFYVGKTTGLISREVDHQRKKPWWDTIALFTEEDDYFEETDIGAVERILYEKYSDSGAFDLQNKQHPQSKMDNYHNNFAEYIISIMEHLGYGLENAEEVIEEEVEDAEIDSADALATKVDTAIKGINKTIVGDPMMRYISYSMVEGKKKRYLCTVAPKAKGKYCHVEFFTSLDQVRIKHDFLVPVTGLHNRECTMKVSSEKDIKNMIAVI